MRAALGFIAFLCLTHLCAADSQKLKNIPVTGKTSGTLGGNSADGGKFKGLLTIKQAAMCGDKICFLGTITNGKVKLPDGPEQKVEDINLVSGGRRMLLATAGGLPLTGITGSCDILNLDLGPLNLNLLGLEVALNEVKLDITAQSGPGNLLGNLLCSIAGLLDGGSLSTLLGQLNNLITALLG